MAQDNNVKTIGFAGGCFWGTEHFFKQINGVVNTEVGYANSRIPHPTYMEVSTGETGASECVRVEYDSSVVSLQFLIDMFFKTIDPTSVNRQGNDIGSQYRTGIYYTTADEQDIILEKLKELAPNYSGKIAVEVMPLKSFSQAEAYHQDYLDKNPGGYCHIDPELFKLAQKAKDDTIIQ